MIYYLKLLLSAEKVQKGYYPFCFVFFVRVVRYSSVFYFFVCSLLRLCFVFVACLAVVVVFPFVVLSSSTLRCFVVV